MIRFWNKLWKNLGRDILMEAMIEDMKRARARVEDEEAFWTFRNS